MLVPSAQILSSWRVSTCPQRSTRSYWPHVPLVWEFPSIGLRRVRPPSSGWLGAVGGGARAPSELLGVFPQGGTV